MGQAWAKLAVPLRTGTSNSLEPARGYHPHPCLDFARHPLRDPPRPIAV